MHREGPMHLQIANDLVFGVGGNRMGTPTFVRHTFV